LDKLKIHKEINMKKPQFYAVNIGREIGVFNSWEKCKESVSGYPNALQMKFNNMKDAEYFVKHGKRPCTKPKASKKKGQKFAVIYTDGSASGGLMPEVGSGLIIYLEGVVHKAYYGLYDCVGTNNIAELNGLIAGLEKAAELTTEGYTTEVLTDSNYALKCTALWSYKWKQNDWKTSGKRSPENLELVKKCHSLYDSLKDSVSIKHVKAHAGTEGNEAADLLADMAVSNQQQSLIEMPVSDVLKVI
jgi:ribonuclease HI